MSEHDEQGTLAQDPQTSPFDAIRHEDAEGNEWWSARELAEALGYTTNYRNFRPVITRAEMACEASGHAVSDHFAHARNMVIIGSGAKRRVEDVRLSRYACYLIIQNADPEKPVVALGQTYFAIQTRRQELTDEQALAGLSEDQRRLYTRAQLTEHDRQLASAANAGVITARDFAVFQDHGYMGLYNGERARDIAARKGLRPSQHILDHMGSTELAANLFRATQADDKIRREGIQGKDVANATHFAVGRAVRRFIVEELGGPPPEELPTPPDSIQQVERRERARLEREARVQRQPALFGEGEGASEGDDADDDTDDDTDDTGE
ncbi:MAG TPA: DNA damage-inducible protein D [Ktedonobacterales bacterium]|nr:DNA damage-inducible protein D [Ktedonobacterales bacterium]